MSLFYRRFSVTVVAAALLLGIPAKSQESADVATTSEDTPAAAQTPATTPDDKWHYAISPYLWFAGTHGTAGFQGREVSYHASFSDLFEYLNIGIMGAGEVRKERFVFPVDFLWMKLSDDKPLPAEPFSWRHLDQGEDIPEHTYS